MDSVTRVAIASPLPDGLMVFQTDQRKGFWYAVNNTWLYIPDKTQSGDNLGNHSATQTLNLGSQQLVENTPTSRGDSLAQVTLTAYINQQSNALSAKSQIDNVYRTPARYWPGTVRRLPGHPSIMVYGVTATVPGAGQWLHKGVLIPTLLTIG